MLTLRVKPRSIGFVAGSDWGIQERSGFEQRADDQATLCVTPRAGAAVDWLLRNATGRHWRTDNGDTRAEESQAPPNGAVQAPLSLRPSLPIFATPSQTDESQAARTCFFQTCASHHPRAARQLFTPRARRESNTLIYGVGRMVDPYPARLILPATLSLNRCQQLLQSQNRNQNMQDSSRGLKEEHHSAPCPKVWRNRPPTGNHEFKLGTQSRSALLLPAATHPLQACINSIYCTHYGLEWTHSTRTAGTRCLVTQASPAVSTLPNRSYTRYLNFSPGRYYCVAAIINLCICHLWHTM